MITGDDDEGAWVASSGTFPNPLGIQWAAEGDEWLHHLRAAIAERVPVTGHNIRTREATATIPVQHTLYTPLSPVLRSRLTIARVTGGISVTVEGIGERTADQTEPWIAAIAAASERVGRTHRHFSWSAVISQAPDHLGGIPEALAAPTSVGPLRLRPAGILCRDYGPAPSPPLIGRSIQSSWPFIVEGTNRTYDWSVAAPAAARDLHRLCAILSVAWEGRWVLRAGPQLADMGPVVVPERSPWDPTAPPSPAESTPQRLVSVPDWADGAWDMLNRDPDLANSLPAHYEGLGLSREHPSFALIAFVGSIEALGAKLHDLRRCKSCGVQLGATERFRQALRLVRPAEDAGVLSKAYRPRSETAHAGRLHGAETLLGTLPYPGFLTIGPILEFTWGITRRMRNASRDLLHLALTQGLPLANTGDAADGNTDER